MSLLSKMYGILLRQCQLRPRLADLVLALLVYSCAWLLKLVREVGIERLPRCKKALMQIGVFPIIRHYYEPDFDHGGARQSFSRNRNLPAIDWNEPEQLCLLESFSRAQELADLPLQRPNPLDFYLANGTFESGDAEYWYQLIRTVKPKRIIEIGSGNSTLMARKAIRKNRQDEKSYKCDHICVEPYEMPWLEGTGATVVRRCVEEMDVSFFSELGRNDILFIDSSHMIKPQGDVLFEYLELLPCLKPGVIVHVHDIFSPKDYPRQWLEEEIKFWNEQYLVEAFLSYNRSWKIIGALNYLHHNHYEKLKTRAPFLTPEREPGSLYIQKVD